MDNIKEIKNVFLIGIGGIGMSALARYFNQIGALVKGYDSRKTELTEELENEGIQICYTDNLDNLDREAELVIYTPAIRQNQMLTWYIDNGYPVKKRAEVLGLITSSGICYAVAGTHGKTTTSTMLAEVLYSRPQKVNAFLGGISVNYDTNFLYSKDSDEYVVEADEYDKSFLQLYPYAAILTALDADHLDVYNSEAEMRQSYDQFVSQINTNGFLVSKYELAYNAPDGLKQYTYSLQNDYADVYSKNIQLNKGGYKFDVHAYGEDYEGFILNMGGMYNIENAMAVVAFSLKINVDISQIKDSLANFKGVKRRFEYVYKDDKKVYIDDYAHHPEELANLIKSARALFPGRKVNIIFQPHLYSRTQDFAEQFAEALDLADNVILMDIYPAREEPIEGVSSEMLMSLMGNENKHLLSNDGVEEWVAATVPDLLITAGAGDIDQLVEPIKEIYEQNG